MLPTSIIFFVILCINITYTIILIKENKQLIKTNAKLEAENSLYIKQILELENKLSNYNELKLNNEKMSVEINEKNKNLEELIKSKEDLVRQFKIISTDIIEKQKESFNKVQNEGLTTILNPFKTQISEFEKKINEVNKSTLENKSTMEEKIKNLIDQTKSIGNKAEDLTNALTSNKKLQGNYGEFQLENLLELCGFVENVDYVKQETTYNEEQNVVHRPDIIINLPNNRRVIIDSKVSLNNYIEYTKTIDCIEKEAYLKKYVNDLKNHISKELGAKEYHKELKSKSLDFVFMFLPLENAYLDAINYDRSLYSYAFKNKVVIATASSLMPILRTIEKLWNIEKQNKNVEEIAKLATKLIDKMSNFFGCMENINKNLNQARESYDHAISYAKTGNGNILKTVNEIAILIGKHEAKQNRLMQLDFDGKDELENKDDSES